MKNKKALSILSLFCISTLILTTNVNSYAEFIHPEDKAYSLAENNEKIKVENQKNLEILENEFKANKTSINEQLDRFLEEDLKYFTPEEAEQVKQTINNNRPIEAGNIRPSAYLPDYEFDPESSDMMIANAAIAYFKLKDYTLSAHLLSRALSVKSHAKYQPSNSLKNFLYNTVAYKSLKDKKRYPNGSINRNAIFQNRFNRDEADAYYSIHKFTAIMTNDRVKIIDTYNYEEGSFSGAAGVAVDALARLQKSGKFVAYDLRINLKR